MFWDEESSDLPRETTCNVVDLAFAIRCKTLPVHHAQPLSDAVLGALPWFGEEPQAGIHLIQAAASGNGWYSPEDGGDDLLYLSRRSKLFIRVPRNRIEDASALSGRTLMVAGHEIEVGEVTVKELTAFPTLYARYVIGTPGDDEESFLQDVTRKLEELNVHCRKMICGKSHTLDLSGDKVQTRSLMLADLRVEDSIKMQEQGLGEGQKFGCGLFVHHKDIKKVEQS